MPATPLADGTLRVESPTPDLSYEMGNLRLFAALNGRGDITRFRLPEGIAILSSWQGSARVDGVPVDWLKVDAIGHSWTLYGGSIDTAITQRTVCDSDTPALYQVWNVRNNGENERIFTLSLDITFDLRIPQVRLGPSAPSTQLYDFLRENRWVKRALRSRRWQLSNGLVEAQKRIRPSVRGAPLAIEPLNDGFRVRGDITATLRSGTTICDWQTRADGVLLNCRIVLGPGSAITLPFVIAAGEAASPAGYRAALDDADVYAAWLSSAFEHPDPVLHSLYITSLNTALSVYKETPSGFRGFWAGPGYAYPPRIYFRDGYWTALNVLPYHPDWVRNHLLTLATGIHSDGSCPSGVIDLTILPFGDQDQDGAADWLPDHQDSPAYFVLLIHDYLAWSGDTSILYEQVPDGRTLLACAQACLNRLVANPAKAYEPNDWTDNVLRSEWVTYDLALLYGALQAGAALGRRMGDTSSAATYAQDAHHIRTLLHIHCWDDSKGSYIDYRRTGDMGGRPYVEDHLALDTLLAVRFGASSPERAERVLSAMKALQTRTNLDQPFGDWGVMCCWPHYGRDADLFGLSREPYNYHNGAVWPYLCAIYAELLIKANAPDWRYVLLRWWEIHLEKEWLTPVEYYAPTGALGAFLQGWSGLAVNAMLSAIGLKPALDGAYQIHPAPWGTSTFNHLELHGRPLTITLPD